MIPGDRFYWDRDIWDAQLAEDLRNAKAVILPQTVSRELYALCTRLCRFVFPDYDCRFRWEGKVGDTLLFWACNAPYPRTLVFPRVETLTGDHPAMKREIKIPDFPFVIKAAQGGEGSRTWLIQSRKQLERTIEILTRLEWQGHFGFILQQYIPGLNRDLRVVVIGDMVRSYWRRNASGFLHSVSRGAEIDPRSDPELQEEGKKAVRKLCRKTGINLAGFDLIFPGGSHRPLFLEINYTFGRKGLGGSDAFYSLLRQAADRWLKCIK